METQDSFGLPNYLEFRHDDHEIFCLLLILLNLHQFIPSTRDGNIFDKTSLYLVHF